MYNFVCFEGKGRYERKTVKKKTGSGREMKDFFLFLRKRHIQLKARRIEEYYGTTVFVVDTMGTVKIESSFSGGTPLVKLMYVIVESPVMTPSVILHEGCTWLKQSR